MVASGITEESRSQNLLPDQFAWSKRFATDVPMKRREAGGRR
jgi:hypothetical protein